MATLKIMSVKSNIWSFSQAVSVACCFLSGASYVPSHGPTPLLLPKPCPIGHSAVTDQFCICTVQYDRHYPNAALKM